MNAYVCITNLQRDPIFLSVLDIHSPTLEHNAHERTRMRYARHTHTCIHTYRRAARTCLHARPHSTYTQALGSIIFMPRTSYCAKRHFCTASDERKWRGSRNESCFLQGYAHTSKHALEQDVNKEIAVYLSHHDDEVDSHFLPSNGLLITVARGNKCHKKVNRNNLGNSFKPAVPLHCL